MTKSLRDLLSNVGVTLMSGEDTIMRLHSLLLSGAVLWPLGAHAAAIDLGTAATFGVLGASTVTNTGAHSHRR